MQDSITSKFRSRVELPTDEIDDLLDSAQRWIGRRLDGGWRLDRLLGVGATAAVYEASLPSGRRAAIKLLHECYFRHELVRARLRREAHVARVIEHPAAVSVWGYVESESGPMFLIMERLEGESLASYLQRRGPLSVREALSVAYSTLDVIVSAHAKNILHRDLKPENLFVTRDGEIKVLDFGVAGFKTTAADSATPDSGLTCSRTLLGTPGFMPPEQALGRHDDVDERSDLWAVGATVFALLTGHVVHESRTSNEILIYTATRPAPSLVSALPNASPELAYWVDRALAFDRSHRWQSAKEMQNALRALLEIELSRSRRSRSLIEALSRAPRRSFSVAMMAVMTVVAFSGGFWACTAQSRQEVVHAPVPVFGLAVDIAPIKALDADPAIANDDNAPKVVRIDDLPRIDQDRSTQRRRVRSGADHATPENSGPSDAAKEKRRSKVLQLRREKGRNVIA